jgi:hypothetical protein
MANEAIRVLFRGWAARHGLRPVPSAWDGTGVGSVGIRVRKGRVSVEQIVPINPATYATKLRGLLPWQSEESVSKTGYAYPLLNATESEAVAFFST